jgi:hypothetical protein
MLCLAACTSTRAPERSTYEVVGNVAERIEAVSEIIAQSTSLPTPLLDAQFVEEKIGDGELGPSDYRAFTLLQVAPADLPKWQAVLTPLERTPAYSAPTQPYAWWVEESEFATLQFYAPDSLSGRINGWVAIDVNTARIYIYSFTT